MDSTTPIRIAFVGRAKVGKTMCAEYLRVAHGFNRKSLGWPINKLLKWLLYYNRDQRVSWEKKRELYDAIYKIDPNLLIGFLERNMETSTANVVVDDVRYTDEALRLRKMGFIIVRVTTPRGKKLHVTKALGKTAHPGTLLLNEMYNKDFTTDLQVEYSIANDTREGTKRQLDILVEKLTNRT